MNPKQVEAVKKDMAERGIKHYTILPGNHCLWVSYNVRFEATINLYFIFNSEDEIIDVQVD